MTMTTISRRKILHRFASTALATSGTGIIGAAEKSSPLATLPLGLDGHAVRGMKWKSLQLIEYAAKNQLDAVLFNGPHYFESLDSEHLKRVKAAADAAGLRIYIGAGGISEGAKSYRDTYGSGADTLREGLRIARALGSPVVNCRIGNIDDRYSEGGIAARLEEAARTLKAVRDEARDHGVKFAFENHAGDTRSEEVLSLIEAVGTDLCGVMLDPGNALWAMEDPMEQLERLGPHVLCSSVRDYMVWPSEQGAIFQWTAIGEGLMDVPAYVKTFKKLCPGVPLFVETISNQARPIPFLTKEFLAGFPGLKVTDITSFLKLCQQGTPPAILEAPEGTDAKSFDQDLQISEFEKSIATLRKYA